MEPTIQQLPKSTHTLVVSYLGVRRAIGVIGLLLPIVLGPVGWLVFGIEIQDNMSSYYHTPLRDVFVGSMCAIGIFLFCYRGYDWIESWTGNLGCLSALGVALCPLDANSDPLYQRSVLGYLHTVSGGAFFLTLAFYSLYHFPSSKAEKHEVAPHEAQRNFVYRTSGVVILLCMAAMAPTSFSFRQGRNAVSTTTTSCSGWSGSPSGLSRPHGLPRAHHLCRHCGRPAGVARRTSAETRISG